MTRAPRWLLFLIMLLAIGVTLTAGVDGARSIAGAAWHRAAFQAVVILAGAIGVGIGLGRFRDAAAWAMVSAGVTVALAAVLANTSGGAAQGTRFNLSGMFVRFRNDPAAAAELLGGLSMFCLAGLTLMLRAPGVAFGRLLAGVGLLAPVVAGVWLVTVGPLSAWAMSLHPIAQAVLALVGFLIALALVSAGGHLIIRALEVGASDPRRADA